MSLESKRGLSIAAPVTARPFGMEILMNKKVKEKDAERPQRRAFFGQLFATVGGGILAGGFLRSLLGSNKRAFSRDQPVSMTAHPMAVPRTKEGSKSNVE